MREREGKNQASYVQKMILSGNPSECVKGGGRMEGELSSDFIRQIRLYLNGVAGQ